MNTYLKTLSRMFKKHITRLISIIIMVVVAIGLSAGLGMSCDIIKNSLTDYYIRQNVSDLIVKDSSGKGFSTSQIDALGGIYGTTNINYGMSLDVRMNVDGVEKLIRLYFLHELDAPTVNIPSASESVEIDEGKTYAFCEQSDSRMTAFPLGQEIEIDFAKILTQSSDEELDSNFLTALGKLSATVTVKSAIQSPLLFALDGEPSYENGDIELPDTVNALNDLICLDGVLYLPFSVLPTYADVYRQMQVPEPIIPSMPNANNTLLPTGDLYLAFNERGKFDCFSSGYESYVTAQITLIENALTLASDGEYVASDAEFITLKDNFSFSSLSAYADKIQGLSIIFIVTFILICSLVVFSNMTRLIDEERGQVACLMTQGYSAAKIIFKYCLFALVAAAIGGVGGYFLGTALASLIYYVFNYSFAMPPMTNIAGTLLYFIVLFILLAVAFFSTLHAGRKMTDENPAALLRPKPPKAGRKVILEKIPLLWNRLSFKYKSTMRNVLRYKSRFLMTVVAVAGSMGIVLAGLALLDMCVFQDFGSPAIIGLAIVIVLFAGMLTGVVIYSLTNINISERSREIATLMVLGYNNKEVAGYIYREIYINSAIGAVFGYPCGVLLMWLVFSIMDFGSIDKISWFVWIIAPVLIMLFTAAVTLLLYKKIVGIDMNDSLKAIE